MGRVGKNDRRAIARFATPAAVAAAGVLACAGVASAADAPVEVLVLGTVHMDNPGLDLHNTKVGDVLRPDFQAQIVRITDGLARFKPTVVAVEWPTESAREQYALYLEDKLEPSRNEVVQLGFRLARTAGLKTVYGIDAQLEFPYPAVEAFAKAHGQQPLIDSLHAAVEAVAQAETARLQTQGLISVMRQMNDPESIRSDQDTYRTMLRFGGGDEQPGADLLAAWYKRNFLICANMIQLSKPGDRIVVIFGAGHAFLLRQCAIETPGLKLVEANSYLPE